MITWMCNVISLRRGDGRGFELDGLRNIFKGLQGMRVIVDCRERKYYIMSQEFFLFKALCKDLAIGIGYNDDCLRQFLCL